MQNATVKTTVKPTVKPKRKQRVTLSYSAEQARLIIEDYYATAINKRGMNRHEQMLASQSFVHGLCAMAQLNSMNLSEEDAANVFRALKPMFDKFSGV